MYPYQRPTSSSSSSYPNAPSQQQQQPSSSNHSQQQRASSGSPEQSRSLTMGRVYPMAHEDYRNPPPRQQQQQQQHPPHTQHQRSLSEIHEHRDRDVEERGNFGNRRWMDEQQRSYGPPPNSDRMPYPRQQTNLPSQQQQQQHPSQHGSFSSLSHPTSPSRRPRTPPQHQQYGSHHRPSPRDPTQTGPMSAPPSLVPRINPNASTHSSSNSASTNKSGSAMPHAGPLSHQTSPILPSLMRGSKNHSRLPSWGPHSSTNNNNANDSLSRTDAGPAIPSSSSFGASGHGGHGGNGTSSGAPPPPILPFRGQSVGLGDPFTRSEFSGNQSEKRKRPASESPPNNGPIATTQQSSPTLRGDPMSMSSILGPSSRNGEIEKRRRLDGSSNTNTIIKMEGGGGTMGNASAPTSGGKLTASNLLDSPASNLARRKWSGPIAEEAAQQAAAWRAQEQRWGSTRSPKVGLIALGPEQRATPPAVTMPLKRDNSPARVEGHKRQRSDGYQIDSPLHKSIPLRAQSPPLSSRHPRSTENSPAGYNQPLPSLARSGGGPTKPFTSTKGMGGYYGQNSPPPSQAQMSTYVQQQQQQQQQQSNVNTSPTLPSAPASHVHKPFTGPPHAYGQPSYHAYDSQGRPVEIDVDEVRGGAFAGHGTSTAPIRQEQGMYRHDPSYSDPRSRPAPHVKHPKSTNTTSKIHPNPVANNNSIPVPNPSSSTSASIHQQQNSKSALPSQVTSRPAGGNIKEREPKRRSMTPNALGPARGLLAPSVERLRLIESNVNQRPTVPFKDFNQGLKVDSEAVWETLQQASRREAEAAQLDGGEALEHENHMKGSRSKMRRLGSFQYDPRRSPLLPGELLQANVGATLEIRVSGRYLGLGPSKGQNSHRANHTSWGLGQRFKGGNDDADAQVSGVDGDDVSNKEDGDNVFWNQEALIERKLWGSDIYTDDSDIVAMCLHCGWIEGPTLQDVPLWVPPGKATLAWRQMTRNYEDQGIINRPFTNEPRINNDSIEKRVLHSKSLLSTADLSVIVRIAPKLIAYKGSQRSGVTSRSWGNGHDGVSLFIEQVTLQEAGYASGERGLRNMKHRIDHLARLKTLATIAMDTEVEEKVTKKIQEGGLIDIRMAAAISREVDATQAKPFWKVDVNNGKVLV